MSNLMKSIENRDISERIETLDISLTQRERALRALRRAEKISDVIVGIVNGIKHLLASHEHASKHGLKH
jgi:hypothetical protein